MNVIGHDNPRVQPNVGIVTWQIFPRGLSQPPKFAEVHFAFFHIAEKTLSIPSTDGDKVRSRLRVIVSRKTYGPAPTPLHVV